MIRFLSLQTYRLQRNVNTSFACFHVQGESNTSVALSTHALHRVFLCSRRPRQPNMLHFSFLL